MATEQIGHLLTLAEGDTAAARWLASAIRAWCDGQPWTVAAGINPSQVSRGVRDRHLQHAGELLGHDATELFRAALRFEGTLWPRWSRQGQPPEGASPVNAALFRARMAAPLPGSVRQYQRILRHAVPVSMSPRHRHPDSIKKAGAPGWPYSNANHQHPKI